MSEPGAGVVIVGGGHAGGSAAALLRQADYRGAITIVGEEPIAPYQRPPLSKAWLKGEADAESLALRPDSFYAEQDIGLRLSTRAVSIQRDARTVTLEGGETVSYEALILATGARARRLTLPGSDLGGVMVLRSATDAEGLKQALGPGKRLAVVGGGYIGLEAAASARALGAEAVVIEAMPRILARSSCQALSDFFTGYHEARGVAFELGATIEGFEGKDGHVSGVRLAGGRVIACDDVVVGVGIIPNDELARHAGIACDNGIVVDLEARTSDPAIFAIGDVTQRPLPLYARSHRLESVANALEQARQAASAIAGAPAPAHEVTWNWSDQYDIKLQLAGMPFDADDTILRGDPAAAKFAVFHMKGSVIRAVEAINAPAEFMAGKMLIGSQKPIDRAKLADSRVSMKEVAAG
ncbi:MAG TPA: FAD-dependent oxidoreductase [Caulobacteraceae bacterium]|jgi:3-phenylpropionate/trans-cinnamate dioxygenase ferredoxin reductase subunit|nr:FAD-dependent oxidoreductase [Caulobacteraceae bacterium]